MKKLWMAVLLAILLMVMVVPAAFAQPVGGCPRGFELHEVGEHDEHHDHHIGLKTDLNGDGQICVKHLSEERHVHVDNVVR